MAKRTLLFAGGLLFAGATLASSAQKASEPVVRVTTQLVQVSVVVEDRKGTPVSDLSRDDFTIFDNGREQTVSFFSVETGRPAAPTSEPLPPNIFSNRIERRAPASVTVILLDALNTHFEDQVYAKAQVIKFLEQVQPEDHIAIYSLGSNLKVVHDFTTDAKALIEALHVMQGQESHQAAASEPPKPPTSITVVTPQTGSAASATRPASIQVGLDDYIRQASQQSADFYSMDRTLRTLEALEAIANHLAPLPGRKNLIWVSSSFPFTIGSGTANFANVTRGERSFGVELRKTERVLNDANLAIYPVDARGLIGPYGVDTNMSATRSVTALAPGTPTIEGVGQLTPTKDTMDELARETGGRAFYGTNDIFGSIRRAMDDSRATYTLGYYPSTAKWDGSFHEIRVKVRRPGVKVLSRRGYFAYSEKPLNQKQEEALVRNAINSPLEAARVGLIARVDSAPVGNVLPLTVGIDPLALALKEQGGKRTDDVQLIFAQLGTQGQMLNALTQTMHLQLTPEELAVIRTKGLSVSGQLQLVPNADKLRVIAIDGNSGGVGSVDIPLGQLRSAKF